MNNSVSQIKTLSIRGFVLIAIVVVAILVVNSSLFDEALDPQVAKIMATPEPVALEDNAYTLLSGLTASSEKDPKEVGKLIIAEFRRLAAANEIISLDEAEYIALMGGTDLDTKWLDHFESLPCTPRRELSCFRRIGQELREHPIDNERLREMLKRYATIITYQKFSENDELGPWSQLPPYNVLMNLSKVYLVKQYQSGNNQIFFDALEADMAFWKLLLDDGKSLIAKMVGIAGIWSDIQFISEIIASEELNPQQISQFQKLLVPLTKSEQDISESFISEFRSVLSHQDFHFTAEDMSTLKRWLIAATYQENATLNDYYQIFLQPIMALSRVSAKEFIVNQQTIQAPEKTYRLFPPTLYNLGGKILNYETRYGAEDYISRAHDLSGMIALVSLQLEIEKNANQNVELLVGNSEFRNPYNDNAMQYDKVENSLSFDCLSPGNLCKISL